jgi:hypothetical protein
VQMVEALAEQFGDVQGLMRPPAAPPMSKRLLSSLPVLELTAVSTALLAACIVCCGAATGIDALLQPSGVHVHHISLKACSWQSQIVLFLVVEGD